MFLKNCQKYDVSKLVGQIKEFSAYYLRKNYGTLIRHYLWGNSFWSDGYFYETIGRVTAETVEFYIEHQQGKHWMHDSAEVHIDAGGSPKIGQTRLNMFAA